MDPAASVVENGGGKKKPIFRDIRRYYCKYCGICRSKKSLIRSHILTQHKDQELSQASQDSEDELSKRVPRTCQECGAYFQKPAHLKQHMQSHSLEAYIMYDEIIWISCVMHWIPFIELQNAKRQQTLILIGLVSGRVDLL